MATETRHKPTTGASSPHTGVRVRHRAEPNPWHREFQPRGSGGMLRQMQDEMDRWFGRLGVDSSWLSPASWMSSVFHAAGRGGPWPAIDAFQRGNDFIIRADVPGMTRHDLTVEIGEDTVAIRGERTLEQREERDGVFWSERSHGTFCRVVPLPPGAIADSAKANFHNGVLEVVVQAPSRESPRGRRIDITGHDDVTKKSA